MKEVYVLINDVDFQEVIGIYSTLYGAIMAGREYYEDNIFDDSKIVAVPEKGGDNVWLLFEVYDDGEYERTLWGYIQRFEVKE